ncbi:tetratricopeptide repeat protein [Flavobacterium sp. RSSB_23]|uniref:tetratricopeptide repeat protein n=1 Tax=Flavobacterium sp. RSSB_23 TaxID=3447668 RepID=UPI003F3D7BBA
MASNVPTVRQTSWISVIPQISFMLILIFIYHKMNFEDPALYGAITYLTISMSLRYFVPKNHREGLKLTKEHKFENAIPKFENSYKFFTQNNWIDKYRFITLLSSSKMNYREMALCNIAFCYSQIGNGEKSIEYYKKTLEEFPENGLALTGLKMLTSIENK